LFQLNVKNRVTGEILQVIPQQSPQRGVNHNLGLIAGDTRPPQVTLGPTPSDSFDPSSPVIVGFSLPMDPETLTASNFIVEGLLANGNWTHIAGSVQVTADNLTATFVPATGLQEGTKYRIRFSGARSGTWWELLTTGPIYFTTFGPHHLCLNNSSVPCPVTFAPPNDPVTGQPLNLVDVAYLERPDLAGKNPTKTYVIALSDSATGVNFLTFDVTDPSAPRQLAGVSSAGRKQRITVARNVSIDLTADITPCSGSSPTSIFKGDLAVTSTFNTYYSFVTFWDITDLTKPCILGNKLLTADPDTLRDYSRKGTVHAAGYARGVATLPFPNGLEAYVAVGAVGLMSADVGKNIPEQTPSAREAEGMYPGDFQDVIAVYNQLLAVEKVGGDQPGALDLFDASLNELMTFALGDAPRCLVYAQGFPVDLKGDGVITPDEIRKIVFVGSEHSVQFIDVTDFTNPRFLGNVPVPGIVHSVDIDVSRKRLYATINNPGELLVIDVSNPRLAGLINRNNNPNGLDDRILATIQYPGAGGFKLDANLGLAFVAVPGRGLDVVVVTDICCDLAVDRAPKQTDGNTGGKDQELKDEREAIKQGLSKGLAAAIQPCGIDPVAKKITILVLLGHKICANSSPQMLGVS
jgi:Bacterial Ig-like domain